MILIIKAQSADEVREIVESHGVQCGPIASLGSNQFKTFARISFEESATWFVAPMNHVIEGYGYPNGSLLWYGPESPLKDLVNL